jgi:hypothetical protein
MRKCNPRLAQFRNRRKALLPQIAQLTQLGLSCREIAEKLGLAKSTVHYWLKKLPPEAEVRGSPDVAKKIAEKIARRNPRRYDAIFSRAIKAWDSSQSEKEIRVVEQTSKTDAEGGETKKEKRSTRTETHAGDSALLTKAIEALKAIDRLQKVDVPRQSGDRTEGRTIPLSSLSVEDFHNLSDEQLDALEARLLAKYGKGGRPAGSPSEQPKHQEQLP